MTAEATMNKYRFLRLPLIVALVASICADLMGIGGWRPVAAGVCPPVPNTPFFTIVYGTVTLDDADAPIGTVVEARSPRDDVVGCFVVSEAGNYGAMYVYGKDISVNPPVPGMQSGEVIAFYVNGAEATASPELAWSNDRDLHQVNLSATSTTCYDFDGSGQVDLPDVMRVASRWRAKCGDPDPRWPSYDPLYDIDDDCDIDIVDIMLVVKHWGESCE
jgi:hypothetical protein